jgi:large subunit ribosomal protein L22
MVEAHATAKYVRTSAQKAGLVMDLFRGRDVNQALATLKYARKRVAGDIEKVLRSAIANAQQKDGFAGDVDRLYVAACYADQGPSMKRVRPAPMGRAFRVVKRTTHLTVKVAERAVKIAAAPAGTPASKRAAAPKRPGASGSRATGRTARPARAKKAGV